MSTNDSLDRRQEKTRQAIRRAFIELLFELNYNDVTVAAVAQRANVGRSTLYEHFRTKSDMLRDSLTMPMSALAAVIGSRDVPAQLGWWLQHFKERQALGRVLFYLPARDIMLDVLAELIEARLEKLSDTPPPIPLRLLASQIAAAQFAVLTPWILGQVSVSQTVLADVIHRTSQGLVAAVLGD
ncbi:bacterial regulatory protein, tetR family protein [Asticcacaulis biprosthecium C19]|uniref:Bacterial regulatory protein, tetR family protein n=1 Tax=Asticcacaulis biprosthecium C19 TaxID=715226 RepID=F4QQE6_9CAUL|nr:TetR/AcrR family transcriptional regulator [Asticcacaulis biprosthecium]EGF90433.1 bacterial regulatory protein, tetR family protein [Asticcacaulis biprosthecium C19]